MGLVWQASLEGNVFEKYFYDKTISEYVTIIVAVSLLGRAEVKFWPEIKSDNGGGKRDSFRRKRRLEFFK